MWDFLLDFLFPKKCVGCRKEGTWFCPDCLSKINFSEAPLSYLPSSNLAGLIPVASFEGCLKEAIHAFKYEGLKELAEPLAGLLIQHLQDDRLKFVRQSILVPVPLHRNREIERGFNQSALLAEKVGQKLNLKTEIGLLVKIKKTPPQVELKGKERRKNVKGAFVVFDKKKVLGKKILLVDDVMTTGSTLNECAKVLKKAGARKVWGLVLAKD